VFVWATHLVEQPNPLFLGYLTSSPHIAVTLSDFLALF